MGRIRRRSTQYQTTLFYTKDDDRLKILQQILTSVFLYLRGSDDDDDKCVYDDSTNILLLPSNENYRMNHHLSHNAILQISDDMVQHRYQLIQHIHELVSILSSLSSTDEWNNRSNRDQHQQQQQETLEECMVQLRRSIYVYSTTTIPQQYQYIHNIYHELMKTIRTITATAVTKDVTNVVTTTLPQQEEQAFTVLIQQILYEYTIQLQYEEHILLPTILNNIFHRIYDDDDDAVTDNSDKNHNNRKKNLKTRNGIIQQLQYCIHILLLFRNHRYRHCRVPRTTTTTPTPITTIVQLPSVVYKIDTKRLLHMFITQENNNSDHTNNNKNKEQQKFIQQSEQDLHHPSNNRRNTTKINIDNNYNTNKQLNNNDDSSRNSISNQDRRVEQQQQQKQSFHYHRNVWEILLRYTFLSSFISQTAATDNIIPRGIVNNNNNKSSTTVTSILMIGSNGSGKTHFCNELEQLVLLQQQRCVTPSTKTKVIRPRLPIDILQGSVGETEDLLVSLFETIIIELRRKVDSCSDVNTTNVLVIIDDIEHIIGLGDVNNDQSNQFIRRCRSTFSVLLNKLYRYVHSLDTYAANNDSNFNIVLFFSTSYREIGSSMILNVDHICYIEPPDAQARRTLIESLLLVNSDIVGFYDSTLNDLVEFTVGKSYAEIVLMCRQAIECVAAQDELVYSKNSTDCEGCNLHQLYVEKALVIMKERLQSYTPESVRGEYTDGYVDMRVFSARDLLRMQKESSAKINSPSASAAAAWKTLQASIIIPLCQSKQLNVLIDSSNMENQKTVVGGVLLCGESGSGKTEIAWRCATYAAEMLHTITFIEVSCTSLIHKQVGMSEQAIKCLFDAARRASPVILLLDGIETIAAERGNDSTTEGTMDRILSTLLIELDGIIHNSNSGSQSGVAVIGITHDESWIDPALKRPGRLDRAVHMLRDW